MWKFFDPLYLCQGVKLGRVLTQPSPRHHHMLRDKPVQRIVPSGQPGVTPILAICVDGNPGLTLYAEEIQNGLVLYAAQPLAAKVPLRILGTGNEQLRGTQKAANVVR